MKTNTIRVAAYVDAANAFPKKKIYNQKAQEAVTEFLLELDESIGKLKSRVVDMEKLKKIHARKLILLKRAARSAIE